MFPLKLEKINKTYGKGKAAVNALIDVNLALAEKELTMIMGPSGSGKTTLLSICGCILKPSAGQVLINGVEVSCLSEKRLPKIRRQNIGFIFQSFNLIPSLTARENTEISMHISGIKGKEARKRASGLLIELGLAKRLKHYPDELSGGEKQRVAIARALASKPKLILADEPTANLDSKAGHSVSELLKEVARERGASVVVVSHDNRIMDIADRVLWLEDGALMNRKV